MPARLLRRLLAACSPLALLATCTPFGADVGGGSDDASTNDTGTTDPDASDAGASEAATTEPPNGDGGIAIEDAALCPSACAAGTACSPNGRCMVTGNPTCGSAIVIPTAGGQFSGRICDTKAPEILLCGTATRPAQVFRVPENAAFTTAVITGMDDAAMRVAASMTCPGTSGTSCQSSSGTVMRSVTPGMHVLIARSGVAPPQCVDYAVDFK